MRVSATWAVLATTAMLILTACGGDSDNGDDEPAATSPVAEATNTEPGEATQAASPQAAGESFADFDPQMQEDVNVVCVRASRATAEDPFWGSDTTGLSMQAGELGTTLEQHGEALRDAQETRDEAALLQVAADVVASCDAIAWVQLDEELADFTQDQQEAIGALCTWAGEVVAAPVGAPPPYPEPHSSSVGTQLENGYYGLVLAEWGPALAAAIDASDETALRAVVPNISASCQEIGWTPT